MSLIFKATNPGATQPTWPQPTGWRHEAYFDKPDALSLDIAGYHGVADRAIIEAYLAAEEGGDSFSDVVFRGYVLPPDEAGSKVAKVSVPSIEKILDGSRWTVPVRYPAGTTLTKMLTHDWPASSVEKPGLLCMANSMVQPGSFILHSGNVWKLAQGGSGYLGSLQSKHVYIDSVQQTWHTSPSLTSGKFYQDADYLYIYSSRNPYYSIVLVEGIYETNIRLGTIENGSTTFAYSWRIGAANVYKEITRLILATDQEWQFSHNQDGYTYLNVASSIGRGASNTNYPTYRYDLCEIVRQKRLTTGGARPVHALRGEGIGKGQSKQYYTEASFPQGLRFVERAEYSSQFADQLRGTIGKLYDNYQDQSAWKITAEDDPSLMPGDWIKIVPEFDQPVIERVKQITRSSDSPMVIYAGQRPLDAEDILQAKSDWRDQMQRDLDLEYSSITANGQENVDNDTPCDIILDVPEDDWDDELDSTWLMSIKMTAFEAVDGGGTVATTYHGVGNDETYTGADGAHSDHDLGGITGEATNGNIFDIIDQVGVDYVNIDGVTVVEDVTFYNSYNQKFTGENHVHGFGSYTYPGTADDHEDHDLPLNPGGTVSSVMGGVWHADGFGSLAYLTVTATIINSLYPSGTTVPGTPYYDVAIGETISDLDVGGLIVTGQNTIRISITKYGGTGDVKARAHVSLAGKVAINY
jgi:hypothetical protein